MNHSSLDAYNRALINLEVNCEIIEQPLGHDKYTGNVITIIANQNYTVLSMMTNSCINNNQ